MKKPSFEFFKTRLEELIPDFVKDGKEIIEYTLEEHSNYFDSQIFRGKKTTEEKTDFLDEQKAKLEETLKWEEDQFRLHLAASNCFADLKKPEINLSNFGTIFVFLKENLQEEGFDVSELDFI